MNELKKKPLKDASQPFKLPQKAKDEFNSLCEEFHTSAARELRLFVYQKIEEFKTLKNNKS